MDAISEQTGIPAVYIEANIDSMGQTYTMLGELLGREEEAKVLVDYCNELYTTIETKMAEIGEENKVTMLYLTGENGLNVIARGSYHSQLINLMAVNAADLDNASSKGTGDETSMEQILLWDPAYIIFSPNSAYAKAGSDPVWMELKAIQNGNYYEAPSNPYSWMGFPPSINRYMGLIWLCETFYPDEFDFDLKEETIRFYKLFYHAELTDELYETITQNAIR